MSGSANEKNTVINLTFSVGENGDEVYRSSVVFEGELSRTFRSEVQSGKDPVEVFLRMSKYIRWKSSQG